jgi:DNA-binding transcriptional ArsR family regulator
MSDERAPDPGQVREITDARTLRALAHPVRIAIIEQLTVFGAMTATEVGDRIGESPTTCSFHLRQLARYGFVQEAGGGKGRARPWRMTTLGMSYSSNSGDPEHDLAATALSRLVRERQVRRYEEWVASRTSYPAEWQDAAVDSEFVVYLTPGELKELYGEISALVLPRMMERLTRADRRPPGSVPVEMQLLAYPLAIPAPGGDDPDGAAS